MDKVCTENVSINEDAEEYTESTLLRLPELLSKPKKIKPPSIFWRLLTFVTVFQALELQVHTAWIYDFFNAKSEAEKKRIRRHLKKTYKLFYRQMPIVGKRKRRSASFQARSFKLVDSPLPFERKYSEEISKVEEGLEKDPFFVKYFKEVAIPKLLESLSKIEIEEKTIKELEEDKKRFVSLLSQQKPYTKALLKRWQKLKTCKTCKSLSQIIENVYDLFIQCNIFISQLKSNPAFLSSLQPQRTFP